VAPGDQHRCRIDLEGLSMVGLADDVAAVIRWARNEQATVVGHAFGKRVARMTAPANCGHDRQHDEMGLAPCRISRCRASRS